MNTIYKAIGAALLFLALFASCEKDDGYSISTPVIQSANIYPVTFSFGDEVTLTAQLSDKETRLAQLTASIIAGERVIGEQTIPLSGNDEEINAPLFIPLVDNLADSDVKITLTLRNVLKGEITHEITGLIGKRAYYNQLYLVPDNGKIITLSPQSGNKDKYEATGLGLNRSFNYKIAQKLTANNQIDYSGLVWGDLNGRMTLVDDKGKSLFAFASGIDYIQNFVFDNYGFGITISGANFGPNDLMLSLFDDVTLDNERFHTLTRSLSKGQEYTLFGDLADDIIVYNTDFFDRLATNKVKFLGETGEYTLYYNTLRQHVIVGVDNPAYPDFILMTGGGLGYPSKVSGIDKEHTWWGFGNVRNFILFRKIAENVYQGTMWIHAKDDGWVSFKPYETTGWGGEKRFDAFTYTGENVLESSDGGDWHPNSTIDTDAFYRFTIHWVQNTVHVEKITL
ncbi:MAG: hypothetical protein LBB85_09700 [Dysgonamonadaceae bacterium]|jgi:hypothetical protein|nr:hypothetical protein [Dysgonamonadaceae bacterium]